MADRAAGERHRGDPAALIAAYEQLRERVLAERPDGWRAGHGVLATRGMVAWMAIWTELAPLGAAAAQAPEPAALFAGSSPSPTPRSLRAASSPDPAEIVAVLSEMALAHAA